MHGSCEALCRLGHCPKEKTAGSQVPSDTLLACADAMSKAIYEHLSAASFNRHDAWEETCCAMEEARLKYEESKQANMRIDEHTTKQTVKKG